MDAREALWCPLKFARANWPSAGFYKEQEDVILSVRDSIETYVPAGNGLGKDYVAGYIALSFFLNPMMYFDREYVMQVERTRSDTNPFPHARRVVTTSVKDVQIKLLWAEIGRFLTTCRKDAFGAPLIGKNGLLSLNDREVRFSFERDATEGNVMNFLKGQVCGDGAEGLSGLHAPYTLLIGDEATGISDLAYSAGQGWAKRMLFISNCWDSQNFFRRAVDAGDLVAV